MRKVRSVALLLIITAITVQARGDGVFVRFKLEEPENTRYFVQLAGYVHVPDWYLPGAVLPAGADRSADLRVASGEFTPWFDLTKHAGKSLHGPLSRAGGVAEFPAVPAASCGPIGDGLAPHPSPLAPHPSSLTPRPSPLAPHPSPLTPYPSTPRTTSPRRPRRFRCPPTAVRPWPWANSRRPTRWPRPPGCKAFACGHGPGDRRRRPWNS